MQHLSAWVSGLKLYKFDIGVDKKLLQRLLIVFVIIALVVLFKVLGLGQYLTLDYLKASQDKFAQLYTNNRFAVIAAYMTVYIIVTALSLPGAAVWLPGSFCATGCKTNSAKNSLP